jgi:hypothetical protein
MSKYLHLVITLVVSTAVIVANVVSDPHVLGVVIDTAKEVMEILTIIN